MKNAKDFQINFKIAGSMMGVTFNDFPARLAAKMFFGVTYPKGVQCPMKYARVEAFAKFCKAKGISVGIAKMEQNRFGHFVTTHFENYNA